MKKWQRILIQVLKALEQLMTGILILIVLLILGMNIIPKIFGYMPYKVQTGSMEPKYHIGCMVYVKKVPSSELKVGDAVTFNYGGLIVTHEIIEIDRENDKFTTKGLANQNTSESFNYSSIIGKASDFSIPYAGYVLEWLSLNQSKYMLLLYIGGLFLIMVINKYLPKLFKPNSAEGGDNNE